MEITGKFIRYYDIISGDKNGREWFKTTFTIMTTDGHSSMVGFTVFGSDKVAKVKLLNPGDTVCVQFYPESRVFDDKVYTELNMVKIMVAKPLSA